MDEKKKNVDAIIRFIKFYRESDEIPDLEDGEMDYFDQDDDDDLPYLGIH